MNDYYQSELDFETRGIRSGNPCQRLGAPVGGGMKIIDALVAKLPPFPFQGASAPAPTESTP